MQILINDDLLPVGDSCNLTWAVDRKPDVLKDFVALSEEIFTPPDITQCTHINQRFISTLPITFLVNHYQNIVSVWMGINETVLRARCHSYHPAIGVKALKGHKAQTLKTGLTSFFLYLQPDSRQMSVLCHT